MSNQKKTRRLRFSVSRKNVDRASQDDVTQSDNACDSVEPSIEQLDTGGQSQDDESDGASAWRVVGASVVGTSHLADGSPCQDAHRFIELPNGTIIAAVADGAGSAPRSQEGSQRVAARVVLTLAEQLVSRQSSGDPVVWIEYLRMAFLDARAALVDYAAREETSVRAFATTLTCAVASAECFMVAQIGDGFCVTLEADGALRSVTEPERGEYANEVTFLADRTAVEDLDVKFVPEPVDGFVLSTDGLLRLALKLPDHRPSDGFFRPLLSFMAEESGDSDLDRQSRIEALLGSERVNARTDDDKTLVIAVRTGGSVDASPPDSGNGIGDESAESAVADNASDDDAAPSGPESPAGDDTGAVPIDNPDQMPGHDSGRIEEAEATDPPSESALGDSDKDNFSMPPGR